jgi:dTDP-4-dehydrorhamnose 3,5-epimerase
MFEFLKSAIPGCMEIQPRVFDDERGRFVKIFHEGLFAERGLCTDFAEEFYSRSHRGVIRGLHFQVPPEDHVKLVYCVEGRVLDAVVDLRRGSATFGRHALFELSAVQANAVYIPRGLAHGFFTFSDEATLVYKVSTIHSPQYDAGIRWDSVGIEWPVSDPIVSIRDAALPAMADFDSPFRYE